MAITPNVPALPDRCTAELWLTSLTSKVVIFLAGSKDGSFTMPESTTILIPSIVSDVSALFVAKTIFLFPLGVRSKTFEEIKN